jgi:hypothetical protein
MTRVLGGARPAVPEVPLPRGRAPRRRVRELYRLTHRRRGRTVAERRLDPGIPVIRNGAAGN